jgi:hypothetical protein
VYDYDEGLEPMEPVTLDAIDAMDAAACDHPPARLYSWTAGDGVLCIACCVCGAVLRGGA